MRFVSALRLEQDEEEYEGILYGYGFSYASLNNMGSGMQGQPVSEIGVSKDSCAPGWPPNFLQVRTTSEFFFWVQVS